MSDSTPTPRSGIPTITVEELNADECNYLGLDETMRDTGGLPYVRVTITYSPEAPTPRDIYEHIGVLTEARVSPEHIQEV